MTDHGKAGNTVFTSVRRQDIRKAPVHLVGFSRLRRVPTAAVALRRDLLTFGGDEMLMSGNVPLHGTAASSEPHLSQAFMAYYRITDTVAQHCIQYRAVPVEYVLLLWLRFCARRFLKSVCLEAAKL